jgi:ligand-binding SRPBCC domain-containing protein
VLRLFPVVMALRHGPCDPPARFQEESVRGPFRRSFHLHEFFSEGEHVVVRNSLDVQVPWYLGGELAMRLLVCPPFRRLFAVRHRALSELARQGWWPRAPASA